MAVGCFLDKDNPPDEAALREALGTAYPQWERLVHFMDASYGLQVAFTYGGKNYGWNLWYRQAGKALTSLFPQQGYLIAQVVLGKAQTEAAESLDLGVKVRERLINTPQLHDGKWLWIPVADEQDAADVEKLLKLKRKPKP